MKPQYDFSKGMSTETVDRDSMNLPHVAAPAGMLKTPDTRERETCIGDLCIENACHF